jgi:uncharacterized protein (DUF2147 family)
MVLKLFFCYIFIFFCATRLAPAINQCDRIIGRWISLQHNVIVQVYKDSTTFKGKVLWFDDSDDKSQPMNIRTDTKNPNMGLRRRKILGLDVVEGLTYNAEHNDWQNGKIYDVKTGRIWSSTIKLENDSILKIRGFWHFEFIGKTMTFKRLL